MCDGLTAPPGHGGLVVLKFGSSVLRDGRGFRSAAAEVRRSLDEGQRVVVVVSAVWGATDALLSQAAALSPRPPEGLLTRLLATGEAASVALMAMALAEAGVEAHALDSEALGLRTEGPLLEAEPRTVALDALREALSRGEAVVVPGFVGVSESGEPSLLGRGGSDLTALFLARSLGADACTLVKDVDGVHSTDPRRTAGATRLERASWQEVMAVGGGVVQPRALAWARDRCLSFRVAAPGGSGTVVGPPWSLHAEVAP